MAGPFKLKSGNSPLFKQMASSPVKKTYKEAYKAAQKKGWTKEGETETAYIKRAEAENVEKYGTTEPTKKAAEVGVSKESLAEGKRRVDAGTQKIKLKTTKDVTLSGKPKVETLSKIKLDTKSKPKTRKEIRAQKLESKKAGMSRKDIKTQKLKSKLAAADPGSRKAKRLARRYDRKTTVKAKKGEAGKKQQIASAEEKFPEGITVRG